MAVAASAGFIGIQSYQQFSKMENQALQECYRHFAGEGFGEVSEGDLSTSGIETVFPEPMQKRFRTTCTYQGATILLESKPFGEWYVVADEGLD